MNRYTQIFTGGWLVFSALLSSQSMADQAQPAFYYLRCNSTSWDIYPNSPYQLRLQEEGGAYETRVSIRDPKILADSDDCAITRTSKAGEWGADYQHFRLSQNQLLAPAAAWIYPSNDAASEPHFRIKYPALGDYRVQLYPRDALLVLTPIVDQQKPGDLIWALPGRVYKGPEGRLWRQSDGWNPELQQSQSQLSLIDPKTSASIWQYQENGKRLASSQECALEEGLVISTDQEVLALDWATGKILWQNPLNRGFSDSFPILNLTCLGQSPWLYVSYGTFEDPQFGVLERKTGRLRWSVPGHQLLYSPNLRGDTIVLYQDRYDPSAPMQSKRIFSAFVSGGGKKLWTRSESSYSALYQDPEGRIFLSGPSSLQRLDEKSGQTLWTLDTAGRWVSPSFEASGMYLLSENELKKVDPVDGSLQWSFVSLSQQYLAVTYLNHEKILIREGSGILALRADSGELMWQSDLQLFGNHLNISHDRFGRLFVASGSWLVRLDPRTGSELWRYELKQSSTGVSFPEGPVNIQGVSESDQSQVYALYSGPGYRCQPMGVVALSANGGKEKWKSYHGSPIWIAASDAELLYVAEGCRGPLLMRAIKR